MTGFVVIGYGSLIWDLDDLAPHVEGQWSLYAGPRLPLEFSLVSAKRRRGLALVIDHEHGQSCPSCIISSSRNTIEKVVQDLAARERTSDQNIGFIERNSRAVRSRSVTTLATVRNWLGKTDYDGAIWTDGAPNFESVLGVEFSVATAVAHLRNLEGESAAEAKRYITLAPDKVDTPLRRALSELSWWIEQLY